MYSMNEDFTVDKYQTILLKAKKRFRFITFRELNLTGEISLWRHDVDFSPHRALALALMEAEEGVVSTYFFQVSSRFYNLFEPEITLIVRKIAALGHDIGLHFDPEVLEDGVSSDHESMLILQANLLENIANKKIAVFSLHNPTTISGIAFDEPFCGGLLNATHPSLREEFSYCSDSNGIWRFRPLEAMILDEKITKLYVLTHPEWWQVSRMAPRSRVQRCIEGRAAFSLKYYDNLLSTNNRCNIQDDS
jgi:hypothetical protein